MLRIKKNEVVINSFSHAYIQAIGKFSWCFIQNICSIRPFPRKRNGKRQNGCLRRSYKQLQKEKKRKAKEKRYTHLNAEFQTIARRDMKMKVALLCPTLCNPMDYKVHGILQARIHEWVAFPFSRGSSQPRQ